MANFEFDLTMNLDDLQQIQIQKHLRHKEEKYQKGKERVADPSLNEESSQVIKEGEEEEKIPESSPKKRVSSNKKVRPRSSDQYKEKIMEVVAEQIMMKEQEYQQELIEELRIQKMKAKSKTFHQKGGNKEMIKAKE